MVIKSALCSFCPHQREMKGLSESLRVGETRENLKYLFFFSSI